MTRQGIVQEMTRDCTGVDTVITKKYNIFLKNVCKFAAELLAQRFPSDGFPVVIRQISIGWITGLPLKLRKTIPVFQACFEINGQGKCATYRYVQGVQEKCVCAQRNVSVQSLLLADNYCVQPIAAE